MHWRSLARCLGMDPEVFFPGKNYDKQQIALSICRECPVTQECLEVAFSHPDGGGVWGGTTERQRRKMRVDKRNNKLKLLTS